MSYILQNYVFIPLLNMILWDLELPLITSTQQIPLWGFYVIWSKSLWTEEASPPPKKLEKILIPKYFLPFDILALLPLWSRWLEWRYHLTALIIIIMVSLMCRFHPVRLFFPISPNVHFLFVGTTDTWYSFMLLKSAMKIFLIQKEK